LLNRLLTFLEFSVQPCIATVSLSGDLQQKLNAAARAGFRSVELVEQDLIASGLGAREVRERAAALGIGIAAYQPCRDVEGMPDPLRKAAFDRAERQLDLAADLGAGLLLVCSAVTPLASPDPGRAADDLARLADLAAARGLTVGYEALSWGTHVATHAAAWALVRRAAHPALGLVLDSFHSLVADLSLDDIAAIPGDRIYLVQISDAPRLPMDRMHLSRHYRRLPGLGALDLPRFMAAVAATGYRGPLSVEVFSDALRAADPETVAEDAMLSLAALGRRMPAPGAGRIALPPDCAARAVPQAAAEVLPLGALGLEAQVGAGGARLALRPGADTAPDLSRVLAALGDAVTGVDHLMLRAGQDAARHLQLALSAALGAGWQDLPDLPDPDGPLQLARLAGADARLLVASGPGAGAPRADHLCLATRDILAAAAALSAAGHAVMEVPGAHLALMGAQLQLDPGRTDRLAAAGVLMDADGQGWFRQVVLARPVGGAILSLAERGGGYAGHGLGTAPIWLMHRRGLRPGGGP
jgi:4-hydroxyphenylpyruvate dioxygenase